MNVIRFSKKGLLLKIVAVNICLPLVADAAGFVAAWGDNGNGQAAPPPGIEAVKSISAGAFHNLALRTDGTVLAWGVNTFGQCSVPTGLSGVSGVSAGYSHSVAVKADGTVAAWGNTNGTMTQVPAGLKDVTAAAAGWFHTLALRADGRVIAWGENSAGQCTMPAGLPSVIAIAASELNSAALTASGRVVAWGDNTYGQNDVPPGLTNAIAIAAGERFFAALKADGTVTAWGWGDNGQLEVPEGLSGVVAIDCGSMHTLALKADGRVISWGYRSHSVASVPSTLSSVAAIAAGATHNVVLVPNYLESPIGEIQIIAGPENQSVWAGSNVTFSVQAVSTEPITYQWRRNGTPLVNGGRMSGATNATLTIESVEMSDAGSYSVIVLNAFDGQSTGAVLTVLSPPVIVSHSPDRSAGAGSDISLSAVVIGTSPLSMQWSLNGTNLPATGSVLQLPNVQPGQSGQYTLFVTNAYGVAEANILLTITNTPPTIVRQPAVRERSKPVSTNILVQLGAGVTIDFAAKGSLPLYYQWRLDGTDIQDANDSILSMTNLQVSQSGYYSVKVWNAFGQVVSTKMFLNVLQVMPWGSPFLSGDNVPTGISNVLSVAAGGSHVLALKAGGTVVPFLADKTYIFDPAAYLTNVPPSATNIVEIAAGRVHSIGLRGNGTVIAWGSGASTNVPFGLSNVVSVASGWYHNIALRSNGTVAIWGNSLGLPTPGHVSNVVAVAAGNFHSLALRQDGTVSAWGFGGTATNVPASLSNVIAVAASSTHSLALRADGKVVGWSVSSQAAANVPGNVSNIVAIAAGPGQSMALRADGTIFGWGNLISKNPPSFSNVIAIAAGGVQSAFAVAVIGNGSPVFTIHPANQVWQRGATAQLHARAAGVGPMRYQWEQDSVPIAGATNATLVLTNLQGKHIGSYRVIASNQRGASISRAATLTVVVTNVLTLPQALNATNLVWITNSPSSGPWFAQIRESADGEGAGQSGLTGHGKQSILESSFLGPSTMSFRWKVSSEEAYDFLQFHVDNMTTPYARISGERDWEEVTVSIAAGPHKVRWAYVKDATVSSGRDAGWLDQVTVTPAPPVIIVQPVSQVVLAGTNVTLFSTGTSPAQPTFQWLKNGSEIPGATNPRLTLPSVTRRDSGLYALRVSNAGGSIVSSNAQLKILARQYLDGMRVLADGSVEFESKDEDGGLLLQEDIAKFKIQASSNLTDWVAVPCVPSLIDGKLMFHDTNSASLARGFYRIAEH